MCIYLQYVLLIGSRKRLNALFYRLKIHTAFNINYIDNPIL